jgi:hypothetical protein
MTSPELRFGVPRVCGDTTFLPVVRQSCDGTGTGITGSVTPVALFIVRASEVWFVSFEEGYSPENLIGQITP